MAAPVIPLIVIGTGGYLAWFGIHYFKRGGWPTAPLKSVLQGKGLPAPGAVTLSPDEQAVQTSASQTAAAVSASNQAGTSGAGVSTNNPDAFGDAVAQGAGSSGLVSANETALKIAAATHGWTGAEWTALYNVEMAEGGFSLTATNPSSGAYGMAQFINGPGEYAQYGGNANTASGQATAMCNYIAQRYGTPQLAWAHEQAYNWY